MKETSQKILGKYVPIRVVFPFFVLIFLCTLVYGAGMKLGNTFLSAGGFVGVIFNVIPVCNMCYRRGYADGHHVPDDGDHIVS